MSMLIALIIIAQPLDPVECGALRFSRTPAQIRDQVCVAGDPDARGDYLLRRSKYVGRGTTEVTWAATRRCPGVKAQLAALETLPLPAPDVPGLGEDIQSLTLDGTWYQLEGSARFGGELAKINLESNVGTPLARWVEETFAKLETCWRERRDAA